MMDLSYSDALANAEHLKALGQTTVYLYGDNAKAFPFDKVTKVEEGSTWRSGMPSSCYLLAEVDGLTFKASFDFEPSSANGAATHQISRDQMREMFLKLPAAAQRSFANLLEEKCLPAMTERRSELLVALNRQSDSEDCVRGLIALAHQKEAA